MSTTTLTTHVQPRRRAARGDSDQPCPKDTTLSKGSTFHQTKSPTTAADPVINFKTLPSRSLTSPHALQDLVNQSDKRVDDIIASFDRSLSGLGQDTSHESSLKPGVGRAGTYLLGSANHVATSVYQPLKKPSSSRHVLSDYAAKVIKLHIIDPLVEEESLKEFHPLVKGLPQRIASQQIRCLRDLEKVLIFLAPHTAKSAASYLDFCEVSIQCIHTTVDHLNELDQRRPADRPYTNNYFVDLVGQVRQYAQIMANSRAKKGGEEIKPGEKIVLRGGVAEGKPLELVREVDGKDIPIPAERIEIDDDFDDDVQRSMARKRKCDIGKVEYRACRECGKVYTRPCDLTKHEKTHSRPWKCSDEGCKYYELGWPTEKERDRHMNDKHSSAPALYHCLWKDKGCAYTSKRESNCKQHMEKAHGWDYIRSKSKKGTKLMASAASPSVTLMPTPMSEHMSTPASMTYDGLSPASGFSSHQASVASASPPEFNFNDYDKGYAHPFISPQSDREHTFEQDFNFTNLNYNWNTLGDCFPQYNIPQQPTPVGSDFGQDFELHPSKSAQQSLSSEFSPAASDGMLFDAYESQGYTEFSSHAKTHAHDFALFGEIPQGSTAGDTAAMFPDIDMTGFEVDAGMFDHMSEEEMDQYLYGAD